MRTDCTIDKQQVICRNASTLGYGKYKAQVGDVIAWRDSTEGDTRIGRMIGRIKYAPSLMGDKGPVRNYILAVQLGMEMTSISERWVNPDSVYSVQSIRDHRAVTEYFLSDQMVKAQVHEVRTAASEMWSTLDKYRAWRGKLDRDIAEYESRTPAVSQSTPEVSK